MQLRPPATLASLGLPREARAAELPVARLASALLPRLRAHRPRDPERALLLIAALSVLGLLAALAAVCVTILGIA